MRRVLRCLQAATGWLLLYLVVGGAVGILIQFQAIEVGLGCTKSTEAFGLLNWACASGLTEGWLHVALVWPRFVITLPALFMRFSLAGMKTCDLRTVLNGLPFLVTSMPCFALSWAGTLHWWRMQRAVGVGAVMLLVADIVFLSAVA